MYKYILFDLDGTLTDPGVGITNSVAYALHHYGIENTDRTELYKFIGPPLKDSFMEFYGFPEDKAYEAIDVYREYFRSKGIYENELYDGIADMLTKIKESDRKIALATSKPQEFAEIIIDYFNLREYFDFIAGATMDEQTRIRKSQVIEWVLENMEIEDKAEVLMVGDRMHDIEGAKENSLSSCGVLYGYGDREELEAAGADYIVSSPQEILTVI
ncbi:MAG: HAD family hydrolase [Clostridia bacterium]|nr:HAD family hydrolase [Clostridia bacterium]